MSKGNTFENDLLKLIFNGTTIDYIADNAASSPLQYLYVSLHTADPEDTGDQEEDETEYTGYARVAVERLNSGWTVSGDTASPFADIDFGECTALPGAPITHFAVGTDASGPGKILYSGAVSPSITMAEGVVPRLKSSSTITEN